jgi:hypothetical protein
MVRKDKREKLDNFIKHMEHQLEYFKTINNEVGINACERALEDARQELKGKSPKRAV